MTVQASQIKRVVQSALKEVTPVRLGLWLAVLWLSTGIFGLVAIVTVEQHGHAVRTIFTDAAPSVFAAYEIKSGVEKMDAALANELLYAPGKIEAVETEDNFEK